MIFANFFPQRLFYFTGGDCFSPKTGLRVKPELFFAWKKVAPTLENGEGGLETPVIRAGDFSSGSPLPNQMRLVFH